MNGQDESMGGLPAFRSGEFTGRMGPDGEPERFADVRGGDPRLLQQMELEEYQRRLASPIELESWMTGANRDVRGTTPTSQITLTPGTQYQIRDYTGGRSGEVIASGSTPEELLRLQDIQRGLANQGRFADYRIEQVGGAPAGGLAQYTDPTTGEAVTLLGGDLYNRPGTAVIGDIAKIAAPIALQFVPGLGTALGTKLGLSGLGAKMAGVGLTSALGRTGAGLATGENIGEALKAGAIGGLASGATAGLLGVTGADKALANALGGAKGALAGEGAGQAISQGAGQAAASLPGEIVVSASRLAPAVLGGLGAAGGSLLGNVGQSLTRLDPFQQALDQARLDNEFGLGDTVVTGSRIPAAGIGNAIAGGAPGALNLGAPTDVSLPDSELLVQNTRIRPSPISSGLAAGAPSLLDLGAPADVSLPGEILVQNTRTQPGRITDSLAAAAGSVLPTTPPVADVGEIVVTGSKNKPVDIGGKPTDLLAPVIGNFAVSDLTGGGKSLEQEQAEKKEKKGVGTVGKVLGGLTLLDLLTGMLGGGRGGGAGAGAINTQAGTRASLDPVFGRQLPAARGIFSPQSFAPRDMTGVDFTRYGYGPAMSFFENVPRTPAEYRAALAAAPAASFQRPGNEVADYIRRMVPGATDAEIAAYMQTPDGQSMLATAPSVTGFAEGGMLAAKGGKTSTESRAVEGPGTGRSDEIPALLSDGEYVIDAETVAMLGDGSSKAGAKRLDELRVKVRKHKGRNLAKGKFSANAKRPEKYLAGGRA